MFLAPLVIDEAYFSAIGGSRFYDSAESPFVNLTGDSYKFFRVLRGRRWTAIYHSQFSLSLLGENVNIFGIPSEEAQCNGAMQRMHPLEWSNLRTSDRTSESLYIHHRPLAFAV